MRVQCWPRLLALAALPRRRPIRADRARRSSRRVSRRSSARRTLRLSRRAAAGRQRPQSRPDGSARRRASATRKPSKRKREQQEAIRPRVRAADRASCGRKEAGNFTAPRMVHKPDWAYELYFKRDPRADACQIHAAIPRFTAGAGALFARGAGGADQAMDGAVHAHRLTGGWGTDETHGTAEMMMVVTEDEYRAIAAREGWGPVPDAIKLEFAAPLPFIRAIEEQARPFVRYFAQNDRSTGIQLPAAGHRPDRPARRLPRRRLRQGAAARLFPPRDRDRHRRAGLSGADRTARTGKGRAGSARVHLGRAERGRRSDAGGARASSALRQRAESSTSAIPKAQPSSGFAPCRR